MLIVQVKCVHCVNIEKKNWRDMTTDHFSKAPFMEWFILLLSHNGLAIIISGWSMARECVI